MKSRLASFAIMALASGAVLAGLWMWWRGWRLATVSYAGVPDSFFVLSPRHLLPDQPALFTATLCAYGLAGLLAGGLALLLILRASPIKAAGLLGGTLAGMGFFATHAVIVRNIPALATGPLVLVLDHVAMIGLVAGLWFLLHTAFNYPRPVPTEDFIEANRPAERRLFAESMRMGAKPPWLQSLIRRDARAAVATVEAIKSRQAAAVTTVGGTALMLNYQVQGAGLGVRMLLFSVIGFGTIFVGTMAWSVFDFQYRTGNAEDRTRISWLALGLVLCGWLVVIGASGGTVWLILGGAEPAAQLLVALLALAPPAAATVIVLLLGVSIFFRGAIDPRLAIRKTSLYGFVALIVTVVVAATQNTAVVQLVSHLGLPAQSGSIVAGVAVAVIMTPMRRLIEARMEQVVERVLPASTLAESLREQATVVFADLSGYTELSARDEPTALTLASLLHKESRRWAERHGGRVVKTIGDAVLFAFAEPGPAAALCSDLNEKFATAAGALKLPALPLHFGMHAGEVVRDRNGDIFGGTVNLAARLQGQAGAGELVVSDAVAGPLREAGFDLESLGEKKLKNVPGTVLCHRVRLA